MKRALVLLALAATALPASARERLVPAADFLGPDDAGHVSWVYQIVPKLLGRHVRERSEAKALADLARLAGRHTVLAVLMETDEFVEHWTWLLMDFLRVHREKDKDHRACFGAPRATAGAARPRLASFIAGNRPQSTALSTPFNMTDVIRSALSEDNLFPVYRAYLFPFMAKPLFGNMVVEDNRRDDYLAEFSNVYLHRKMGCLGCHNSRSSTTGPHSGWNRHFPYPAYFEKALFGAHSGRDPRDVGAMFRTAVIAGLDPGSQTETPLASCGTGVRPWGLIAECGRFCTQVPRTPGAYFGGAHEWDATRGSGGSIWEVDVLFERGYGNLLGNRGRIVRTVSPGDESNRRSCLSCPDGASAPLPPAPAALARLLEQKGCTGCHSGDNASAHLVLGNSNDSYRATDGRMLNRVAANFQENLVRVASSEEVFLVDPGQPAESYLVWKLLGRTPDGTTLARMPAGGAPLTDGSPESEMEIVRGWIRTLPATAGCDVCFRQDLTRAVEPRAVEPAPAFAHLVAQNIVNQVWKEVMGYPLTIVNYFPRNSSQRDKLAELVDSVFLASGWSLKKLLLAILGPPRCLVSEYIGTTCFSSYFNRRSPSQSGGTTPYDVGMIFDPWVDRSVPGPAGSHNSMAEGIHRHTTRTILHSIGETLDWPSPPVFWPLDPGGSSETSPYPNKTLAKALGQFVTATEPGSRDSDFFGLLQLETASRRYADVADADRRAGRGRLEWLDFLLGDLENERVRSGRAVTLRELAEIVKDRIVGETRLSDAELAALQSIFLGNALTEPVSRLTPEQQRTAMRSFVRVLLLSPQRLLAGIVPTDFGPAPRLRQRFYSNYCNPLSETFTRLTRGCYRLNCSGEELTIEDLVCEDTARRLLCPGGVCWATFIDPCLLSPECIERKPTIPRKWELAIREIVAKDAIVTAAKGVTLVRTVGKKQALFPLMEKMALRPGDVLRVPPLASLSLLTGKGEKVDVLEQPAPAAKGQFKKGKVTDKERAQLPKAEAMWLVVRTETPQKAEAPWAAPTKISQRVIRNWLLQPWVRRGEGGAILKLHRKQTWDRKRMLEQIIQEPKSPK